MKVAINYRTQDGPWGGGNRFVFSLVEALTGRGDTVSGDLGGAPADVILMIDPRWRNPSVAFGPGAILRHLLLRNPRAIVVHRINECDERKATRGLNRRLQQANYVADHTVFVGSWLRRDLPVWRHKTERDSSVILNGADPEVFHPTGRRLWNGDAPLRMVTHHWGGNWMKGFDIYQRIDRMMADPDWVGRIEFTYIGNLPQGFRFENATYLPPMDGRELAAELGAHDLYVTGSICEPGSNHQNEGALCGLPLLYRESGALPEYCEGFGLGFSDPDGFVAALERMMSEYSRRQAAMAGYPHTTDRMIRGYLTLFDRLVADRDRVLAARRLWRSPWLVARSQAPI